VLQITTGSLDFIEHLVPIPKSLFTEVIYKVLNKKIISFEEFW